MVIALSIMLCAVTQNNPGFVTWLRLNPVLVAPVAVGSLKGGVCNLLSGRYGQISGPFLHRLCVSLALTFSSLWLWASPLSLPKACPAHSHAPESHLQRGDGAELLRLLGRLRVGELQGGPAAHAAAQQWASGPERPLRLHAGVRGHPRPAAVGECSLLLL